MEPEASDRRITATGSATIEPQVEDSDYGSGFDRCPSDVFGSQERAGHERAKLTVRKILVDESLQLWPRDHCRETGREGLRGCLVRKSFPLDAMGNAIAKPGSRQKKDKSGK
ncbi:MAG: hypothetical protein VX438_14580 [Planctomycetota bacterium]|nr:hypothetical protein [Planctomycetota bacterium]